jgi:hypothetical protein
MQPHDDDVREVKARVDLDDPAVNVNEFAVHALPEALSLTWETISFMTPRVEPEVTMTCIS